MQNTDTIQPFLIDKTNIRGRMVRLDESLNTILHQHSYPEPVTHSLADVVIMTSLLAGTLKFQGILTVQVMGQGVISTIIADVTHEGALRACANFNEEKYTTLMKGRDHITTKELIGNQGFMAITVDQAETTERYQGLVALDGDNIVDWIRHYFKQSEQIQTGFKMFLDNDSDGRYKAAAIMLQSIPSEGGTGKQSKSSILEDDWRRTMMLLETVTKEEMLSNELSINDLLFRLFHEDDVRIFDTLSLQHSCRCSKEMVETVIKSLSANDVEDIKKNGKIEITCQFCGKRYHLTDDDLNIKKDNQQ